MQHLRFYITIDYFKELNSLRATFNSNPNDIKIKFSSKIAERLTSFIQEIGESCFLNYQSNHFKVGSRKQGAFWTGKFNCNLMPLWSGVLLNLDEKDDLQTRVHNNFVEGKFRRKL